MSGEGLIHLFPQSVAPTDLPQELLSTLHSPVVTEALTPADPEEANDRLARQLKKLTSREPLEIMSSDLWRDEGMPGPEGDLVEIELTVEEIVHYPASAVIPRAEWNELNDLFPHMEEESLPLGLLLMAIRRTGGKLVVNERHGDVHGRAPVGPVRRKE